MNRLRRISFAGAVLVLACVASPWRAQAQQPAGAQPPGGQEPSAAALAQQATNPFSTSWLLQLQQNENWIDMPAGHENEMRSNLFFQPLMSIPLKNDWGLYIRPVVNVVYSSPTLDQHGAFGHVSGVGDTILGMAAAHPLLGGRLVVGAGPTFIFPTASDRALGQDAWQVGPDAGATILGQHFIAYGFVQQWFKTGGSGPETSQMSGVFNYTYSLRSGWTVGTQPTLDVDWKAPGDRVTFGIGPQVGKMCKCNGLPTLVQVQALYYAMRPDAAGPKWNIQLQVTPAIPALIKKALF
jgi:hypothetical protein